MASFGAGTVVVSSGQVLLIRRKDFGVWPIPAGGVEDGETAARADIPIPAVGSAHVDQMSQRAFAAGPTTARSAK